MEKIKFFKMQSVGNDYIFVDERNEQRVCDPQKSAVFVSNRRFSVGADGLVTIGRSDKADCKMRIFNSDGSEGATCGNALRCVGKYLAGRRKHASFFIETNGGVRRVDVDGEIVRAEMGKALFRAENLPPVGLFVMPYKGREYAFTAVSVANPHAVSFVENFDFPYGEVAAELSSSGIFPYGVNVEFAVVNGKGADVRVVERGSGETFGCGSGACAVAAALKRYDICGGDELEIRFSGGKLNVNIAENFDVFLTGPVSLVCKGVLYES